MIDYNYQIPRPENATNDRDEAREMVRLLRSEYQMLWIDQTNWRSHWDQICKYFSPYDGRYLLGQQGNDQEDMGRRKDQYRINNTAGHIMDVYRAVLSQGLIPRTRPFFTVKSFEDDLMKSRAVQEYCYFSDQMILTMMERSRFYNGGDKVFKETGLFGSSQGFIYDHPTRLAHFKANTIGEFVWAPDAFDEVGSGQTRYRMTAEQICGQFSQKKKEKFCDMPMVIRQAMLDHKPHAKFDVYHSVFPNAQYKFDTLGKEGFTYRSIWYSGVHDEHEVLEDKGFYSNPRLAVRAKIDGCSVYGRGDCMEALGDQKMLQKIEQFKTQALGNQIAPPMLAPMGMKPIGLKVFPNAITYTPQGINADQIKPVFQFQFPLADAQNEIERIEGRLKEILHYNEFLAVLSMDKQATAFEVAKRIEEKIMVIGPTLDYLKTEFIAPAIERYYNILLQNNLLQPAPPELQGQRLKIEYTGILAQAQKMIGASTYEQGLDFATRAAQVFGPGVLQNINSDKTIRNYWTMIGMSPDTQTDEQEVAAQRQQAAQAQKTAQDMQAAAAMAKTAKDASQAQVGNGNLLEHVAQAAGANVQPARNAA